MMKYTLDLAGRDGSGRPEVDRFGGLFTSINDAVAYGKDAIKNGRFVFRPELLWVRDQMGETVLREELLPKGYSVVIRASNGSDQIFVCGGATDQSAHIYAGKIVELNGDKSDPGATVVVFRDGHVIGPTATVRDMTTRAV